MDTQTKKNKQRRSGGETKTSDNNDNNAHTLTHGARVRHFIPNSVSYSQRTM